MSVHVKLWIVLSVLCAMMNPAMGQEQSKNSVNLRADIHFRTSQMLLVSFQRQFVQRSDSLKDSYNGKFYKLDSVRIGLRHKIDSLASSNVVRSKLTNTLDSINRLREKTIDTLNEKLQSLKENTIGEIKDLNLPPELNEKVSALTKEIESFSIPYIPGTSDLSFAQKSSPTILAFNNQSLVDVIKIDALKDVTPDIANISNVTGDLSGYSQQVKELAKGNFEGVEAIAEEKVADLSGLSDIQKQTEVLDEYKEQLAQVQDPNAFKEHGVEQLQQAAMDHFAGKQQVIQEAMDKMAKYKEKYESLPSLNVPLKRPNEMRGKPWFERVVPAFMVQIQKEGDNLLVDFNPYVGYRFTGKLTAGPGWNQRIAYNADDYQFTSKPRIYGPRVFAEYNLWKGFHPRVEVEVMNAYVSPFTKPATIDQGSREWVCGVFVGVKKEYKFIKSVKGTVLIMTRLFDPKHKSPYGDVINARFGFEFPMKKKS